MILNHYVRLFLNANNLAALQWHRHSQIDKKLKDDLLVHGWIRDENKEMILNIPPEIMKLCLIWYHFGLYIIKGPTCMKTNRDDTIITLDHEFVPGSCYGSISMPSTDNTVIY